MACSADPIYISCDVQETPELQKSWDLSVRMWNKVDIWVNNAGQNAHHTFAFETEQSLKNVIATNITGMIYGSQIATREMLKQKNGAIYSIFNNQVCQNCID